jgi:hypothetical protein
VALEDGGGAAMVQETHLAACAAAAAIQRQEGDDVDIVKATRCNTTQQEVETDALVEHDNRLKINQKRHLGSGVGRWRQRGNGLGGASGGLRGGGSNTAMGGQ